MRKIFILGKKLFPICRSLTGGGVRETLKFCNFIDPVYVNSISDLPSNSGLGSSSAFTVGLLKGILTFSENTSKQIRRMWFLLEIM